MPAPKLTSFTRSQLKPRRLKPMKGVAAEAMVLYLDLVSTILLAMMIEMHPGRQVRFEAARLREQQDKLRQRYTEEVV